MTTVTPTGGKGSASNVTGIAISGLADGASNMTFDWNLFNGMTPVITQVAGASTWSAKQDGNASGTLVNFSIGSDGTVTGSFSNGHTAALGQIALAGFPDVKGLQRVGENLFTESLASGQVVIGRFWYRRERNSVRRGARTLERGCSNGVCRSGHLKPMPGR